MSDDASVFSTSPGNMPQQFNVGVKRITGAQLLAAGKRKNWVYFITDIQVCAVYENAGRNVWLGTNGIPVAGDNAIQASLIPVQGQRFYNLATGPQEWKGTSWGAGSYAVSNKLTPRIRLVEESTILSPEVEHYVVVDACQLTFPDDDFSVIGTSLDIFISPEVTGTVLVAPEDFVFNTPGQVGVASLALNPSGIYKLVRTETGVVEVISTDNVDPVLRKSQNLADVANTLIARSNLDVYSKDEVAAIAGMLSTLDAGITISGSPASIVQDPENGFYHISINYNNDPNTVINAQPDDVKQPLTAYAVRAAVEIAVNNAVGMSQFNNISGLAFASTTFSLTVNPDLVTLNVGAAVWVFNTDPYLRVQPIAVRSMPGSVITPVLPAGPAYRYITISTVGDYAVSSTYDPLDFTKALVGRLFSIDGQIKWAVASPAIASSDMSLRTSPLALNGGRLRSKAAGQWLTREAAVLYDEGIGWSQSQNSPHSQTLPLLDDVRIDIVNTDGSLFAQQQQFVKGDQLGDGSPVAVGEYTVQIVYRMLDGRYLVPRPTTKYSTKLLADAAIASVVFNKPTWMEEAIEVCRWVVKGDQFPGSGSYNISVLSNFESRTITSGSGNSAVGGSTSWEVLGVVGGGTLQAGKIYIIQDSGSYSFPAISAVGQALSAMAMPGSIPVLTVQNYPTVFLRDMELQADDDSIQLTVPWVREDFYSTGTYWGW